jgi:hypothetical protein
MQKLSKTYKNKFVIYVHEFFIGIFFQANKSFQIWTLFPGTVNAVNDMTLLLLTNK